MDDVVSPRLRRWGTRSWLVLGVLGMLAAGVWVLAQVSRFRRSAHHRRGARCAVRPGRAVVTDRVLHVGRGARGAALPRRGGARVDLARPRGHRRAVPDDRRPGHRRPRHARHLASRSGGSTSAPATPSSTRSRRAPVTRSAGSGRCCQGSSRARCRWPSVSRWGPSSCTTCSSTGTPRPPGSAVTWAWTPDTGSAIVGDAVMSVRRYFGSLDAVRPSSRPCSSAVPPSPWTCRSPSPSPSSPS